MGEFKYDVEIDLTVPSNHTVMVEMIGRNRRVLETGCATGYMSRVLHSRGCSVVGVELDPVAARQAEAFCERVLVGNLDELDLGELLEPGSFDVVVFGDVLEHLHDPLRTLRSVRPLLAPGGSVVASIPNVAHGAVRLSLLQGRFQYRATGLLDETHIHFFTRETIGTLFQEAGFALARVERIYVGLFDTELGVSPEECDPDVVAQLERDPEALTYQYVAKALLSVDDEVHALQARNEELQTEMMRYIAHARAVEKDRDRWQAAAQDLQEVGAHAAAHPGPHAGPHPGDEVEELRQQMGELSARLDALSAAPGRSPRAAARALPTPAMVRAARALWRVLPEPGRQVARPALQRMRVTLQRPGAQPEQPQTPPVVASEPEDQAVLTEQISVLIPTLNAGPEFARNLDQIRSQQGVLPVEIVVADSGSSDDTVAIAQAMGARILAIEPGSFNHGGTRNRLAELASGEVLVMTVQDARLVGPHALRDLVRLLRSDPAVVAVSARQIPRADTDLFSSYLTEGHARIMAGTRPPDPNIAFGAMTPSQRRSVCALDDVCAVIDREAWRKLRYRDVAFAEDLDFAVRAAERGLRVIATDEVAVVHSHGRPAAYHLRRFAVDRLWVARMIGDEHRHPAAQAGHRAVAGAARTLLRQVSAAGHAATPPAGALASLGAFLREAAAALRPAGVAERVLTGELADLDALLAEEVAVTGGELVDVLRRSMVDNLAVPFLLEFADAQPAVPAQDAERFLAKVAAMVIGSVLGDALHEDPNSPLALALTAGV